MARVRSNQGSNALIGIAGVHYVVSELSRRGLIAMPTIRNTAGIDVLVAEPDGNGQAVLQVKSTGSVRVKEEGRQWWPTPEPEKCLSGSTAFYVFVRWREDLGKFEAFLENADAVAKQVRDNLVEDRKLGHKDFPCWGLPALAREQDQLAEKWRNWRPPRVEES
jgi:hypothetical protein